MENNMKYTGETVQDAPHSNLQPSIEVLATIKGKDSDGDSIVVSTPGNLFAMQSGGELSDCVVIRVPESDLTAFILSPDKITPVPVYVYDAKQMLPKSPPPPPHVRVILSNAIITSDGETPGNAIPAVEICAMLKAVASPDSIESITLATPGGLIPLMTTMPAQSYTIYSAPQTAFTAVAPDGNLPVHLYNSGSLIPPLPVPAVQIILDDLIATALDDPS